MIVAELCNSVKDVEIFMNRLTEYNQITSQIRPVHFLRTPVSGFFSTAHMRINPKFSETQFKTI